ncbi:hypothetical protein [Streptomyces torulosus]|uniref:hypothetical protein n=1 Tax=Streptomyces torulosus TaxID=68276 RepID=UPI0006EB98DA|nr:hypothetical protein [Streptomyces torulosus]
MRSAAVVASTLGLLVATAGSASAATSQSFVYHWSGSRPIAGEVWFNSANHNPAVGRNGFTIKDRMCGDGWFIAVKYRIGSGSWRWTSGISCSEINQSVAGNVARQTIQWRGCKISETDGLTECEGIRNDYVD